MYIYNYIYTVHHQYLQIIVASERCPETASLSSRKLHPGQIAGRTVRSHEIGLTAAVQGQLTLKRAAID